MARSGCVLERKARQPGDVWFHRSAPPLVNSASRCWCKFKREANFYALDGKKMQAILKGFSPVPWQLVCLHSGDERPDICVYISTLQGPPNPQLGLIYIQAPLPQNYNSTGFKLLLHKGFDLLVQNRLWWVVIGDRELEALYFHSSLLFLYAPTIKELDPDLWALKQLSF